MKAIQIVGFKNSGKTTLAVDLAKELRRRGLSVSAAKFSHHPGVDKADADTDRLLAVTSATASLTPAEAAVFWPRKRHLPDLLPLMNADVLIVEGGKTLGFMPRVLLPRGPEDLPDLDDPAAPLALAMMTPLGPVSAPSGPPLLESVARLADLILEKGFLLPGLDCGSCGHASCRELAARIVAGDASPEDCAARNAALSVTVNGLPLAMNPFVEGVIAAGLTGMLSRLKGYAPGKLRVELDV